MSRFVVLFAILALPGRLLGQVSETAKLGRPKPVDRQAAATATEAPQLCTDLAEDLERCKPRWVRFDRGRGDCIPYREAVFMFGGIFSKAAMGRTADVFNVTYDNFYILGLGYQRLCWTWWRFDLGWEVGTSYRFGSVADSAEGWGGLLIRAHGITFCDAITVTPSVTGGFSVVTASIGHEYRRVSNRDGDATFLFYLGPELAISHRRCPNVELFYRLQHRCGGHGTLGNLSEGYNANVLGVRFKF
jgi:hypothetical protein